MINNKMMRTIRIKTIVFAGLGLLAFAPFAGCYRDKADQLYPNGTTGNTTCDTTNITYSGTVKAIIAQNCAISGCHDGSNASTYDMSDYSGLYFYCIATNKLLGSIRHDNGYVAMPQGAPKLDDCSINKITAWVNNGAYNN
jgi:hypothetical protein